MKRIKDIRPQVIAFAQNTRDEVRILGEDRNVAGCVAAQAGMKQQTYLCIMRRRKILNKNLGGDKMKSLSFRAGSYGMFEPTQTSGTFDCGHTSGIGNGTP